LRAALSATFALLAALALAPVQAADTTAAPAPATVQQQADEADDSSMDAEEPTDEPGEAEAAPTEQPAPPAAAPTAPAAPAQPVASAEQPAAAPEATPPPAEEAPAPTPEPATAAQPAQAIPTPPWDRYEVLAQDNIFSRVRGRRPGPASPPPPPPLRQERYMVLKGTVGRGKDYVAFIEDTRTSTTRVCLAGDVVGQAHITSVGRDGLTYEMNGRSTQAAIGDYVGGTITVAGPAPTSAAPAPPAASAPAAAPSDGAMSMLERMRQRRLQEQGK